MPDLIRWDPFAELGHMRRAMERVLDEPFWRPLRLFEAESFIPLDVYEKDDALWVTAPIPGVRPEDIKITVENGVLTIQGEFKQAEEVERERYYRHERRYGSFVRSIALPTTVDVEHIEANYEHGVLKLRLPTLEAARPKQIQVKVGQTVEAGKVEAAANGAR